MTQDSISTSKPKLVIVGILNLNTLEEKFDETIAFITNTHFHTSLNNFTAYWDYY